MLIESRPFFYNQPADGRQLKGICRWAPGDQ